MIILYGNADNSPEQGILQICALKTTTTFNIIYFDLQSRPASKWFQRSTIGANAAIYLKKTIVVNYN